MKNNIPDHSKAAELTEAYMATLASLATLYLICPSNMEPMRKGVALAIKNISKPLDKEGNAKAERVIKKLKTAVALIDAGHEVDYSLVFGKDIIVH